MHYKKENFILKGRSPVLPLWIMLHTGNPIIDFLRATAHSCYINLAGTLSSNVLELPLDCTQIANIIATLNELVGASLN
jgi:hypothetical protein